jgi:hypothetical protein
LGKDNDTEDEDNAMRSPIELQDILERGNPHSAIRNPQLDDALATQGL